MPGTEKKTYDDRELSFPPFVLRGTLPNGLNYFIMEHKKPDDRILAWLVVPVGSIHEQDGEYGIAHFIEHMAFKRTEHFPPGEVVKYFHSIGVDIGSGINALTDIDRTIYKIEIPSEKEEYLIKALTLLCDFASSVIFVPEETEKEKDVILEELRLDSDVMTRLYNAHRDIRFKGSPYAQRYTLGTEETIKNTGAEDLKRFYSYWYRPDIMALIVVGDCGPAETEKKIKHIFQSIPSPEKERPELVVSLKPHHIYTGVFTDVELQESYVSVYYHRDRSPIRNKRDFARRICEEVILEMINMRICEESYNNPDTPVIHGGGCVFRKIKSFNEVKFIATVRPGRETEGLARLSGYIEGLRQKGFTAIEKEETSAQFLEALRRASEKKETRESESYASFMMEAFIKEGIFISPDDCYSFACELLPRISDRQFQETIENLLRPVNMSVIISCPPSSHCNEDDILKTTEKVIAEGAIDYKIKELNYSYNYSSIKRGEILSRKTIRDITELTLKNGLTVMLKTTDFERKKLYVTYVSRGGKLLEPAGMAGMFEVAKSAWAEGGTEDLNQIEIERLFRLKSISLITTGVAAYGLSGHCPSDNMEYLFQWFWQYLVRPAYRDEAINYSIRAIQEYIRQKNQSQDGLIGDEMNSLLLPGNPLSARLSEEEVCRYTDRGDLKKFQLLSSAPSNSQLTLVGSFDMEEAITCASRYFGSLPSGSNPFIEPVYLETTFPSEHIKKIIYKGREDKCLAYMIFPGCMKGAEDEIPLDLLAKILSIRFWNNIREEKGLVYSINAQHYSSGTIKNYGTLKIGFGTDPDIVDYTEECIMSDILDIKEKGINSDELDVAKKILLTGYGEYLKNNSYWLGELYSSSLFKINVERIFTAKRDILHIKDEDIQAAACKYLDKNIFLIAMPEKPDM